MPSPLAHGLVGLTVHVLTARDEGDLRDRSRAALVVGAALAPDLDLVLRLFDGRNHHGAQAHSVGLAMLAGALTAVVLALLRVRRALALGAAVGLAWTSHILLDLVNVDTSPPIGIMALWPFSTRYFKSPVLLFMDIGRTLGWSTVTHNALAGAWECVILVPLLLIAWRLKRRRLEALAWHADSRARP